MPTISKKPLILIDGSSYLHRAFHALPPLVTSDGQPTGAVFGVLNMIRKLLREYEPEHIAVVFDAKGKTFRHDLYAAYKAHRPPMPDELRLQIEPLHAVIRAMGLPLLMVEGVEADDVIGTLAMQTAKQKMPVLISSGDKDLAQLVNAHITLINTMNNEILDEKGVKNKFGVTPKQIIDYLALIGDTVDNVPGVPKVGPKTAVKWLHESGSLENIISGAEGFSGKIGDNLRQSLSQLPLSKQLLTIKCDVPLPVHWQELNLKPADQAVLIDWLKRLEFRSWLGELLSKGDNNVQETKTAYQTILTEPAWHDWFKQLQQQPIFAFDTETTSLSVMNAELVGASFSFKSHEAVYVPIAHDYEGAPQQLPRQTILNALQTLLNDPEKTIIGHNLKYDLNVLANYQIKSTAKLWDTLLASYVLNSANSRHDLDTLALKHFNHNTIHYEDVAGKGAKQVTFNHVKIDQATVYAAEDADIAWQLYELLHAQLEQEPKLKKVFETIEMPLMPVLARMERYGVLIDVKLLQTQSKELAKRIRQLEKQAYELAGETFNLASPKQLQEILYDKGKLPVLSKTPTGAPSTNEAVLQELALDYPLAKVILEFRTLSKLKSTYTDALPMQVNAKTGRVHTSYNQAVTATGRLSSTEPNLQNIPIRNDEGRRIRQAFIAPKGYKIISADYSQIELRIMAELSQDANLLQAFAKNVDVHKATAAEVFNIPVDQVTPQQRRSAKAINFGLIYGMSAFGLARQLGVNREMAQAYMDVYFTRYLKVHHYMESTRAVAHQQGYVETLFGRRLYLPEINARNLQRQRAAERAAINAPLQGTAADIIKLAMIQVDHWLQTADIDAKMIMQVHDELVFEVADQSVDLIVEKIKMMMAQALHIAVPIVVEVGIGNNWDEAH